MAYIVSSKKGHQSNLLSYVHKSLQNDRLDNESEYSILTKVLHPTAAPNKYYEQY